MAERMLAEERRKAEALVTQDKHVNSSHKTISGK